jgi:hypothetical protein
VEPAAGQSDKRGGILASTAARFALRSRPSDETAEKAERIYLCKRRFIALANNAKRNYVMPIIDEAQGIAFRERTWLLGIQNDLDYEGHLLRVFSVGSR